VSESKNAVFLSYAAEDAAPALRLCAALRTAGIEVWFDQSELRGGDAWDAAIRKQIRACALFIPLISTNSQARAEGYFRLEWKLAVDRSHLIAADKAFLLPVVIDDTPDSDARVPDKFREVQWTSLPGGETTPTFLESLQRLLLPGERQASIPIRAATGASYAPTTHGSIPEKSIAVLPFADMSALKDQEYFSDGLAEALIDMLTQVRDLRVPARTSSFSFKGRSDDIATIAAKLRVAHVLEGSVRKAGNTIRVTAHLIRADNGYHLWSKTYDRNIEDIFKVQDEIAGIVVEALKAQLLPAQGVVNAYRTSNMGAYEQYLFAKQFYYLRTADSPKNALAALQRALALDPNYAAAHALLAASITVQMTDGTDPVGLNADQAIAAAERAVALAPELGEAYSARSYVRWLLQWNWSAAQADIEKALQLDPRAYGVQRRCALLLCARGRFTEAIPAAQAATEMDPLDANSWIILGMGCYAAGQSAAGHRALSRALVVSPDSTLANLMLSQNQLATGQISDAMKTNDSQQSEPWRWATVAMAEHSLGHAQESHRVLDELISKYGRRIPLRIAVACAWRGEADAGFDWLERAYQQRDGMLSLVQCEPALRGVHSDACYKALLRKMNFPE
jgi:TolB-like protein/Tfp pilus assembly protein PilF